jgi:hypothetical protein
LLFQCRNLRSVAGAAGRRRRGCSDRRYHFVSPWCQLITTALWKTIARLAQVWLFCRCKLPDGVKDASAGRTALHILGQCLQKAV